MEGAGWEVGECIALSAVIVDGDTIVVAAFGFAIIYFVTSDL